VGKINNFVSMCLAAKLATSRITMNAARHDVLIFVAVFLTILFWYWYILQPVV